MEQAYVKVSGKSLYFIQVNIDGDITPHTFWHSFAAHLVQKKKLKGCSKMLGHSDISTTQVYIQVVNENM